MKIATRNFMIFVTGLVIFVVALIATVLTGDNDLDQGVEWVAHTHRTIAEVQEMSTLVEGMAAAQRAYMMTSKDNFLERYTDKKENVSNNIAHLAELFGDNASQKARLAEFQTYFIEFTTMMEEHTTKFKKQNVQYFSDVESVSQMKENLLRVNDAILKDEYDLLRHRVERLINKKNYYLTILMIGFGVGAGLLVLFNIFLLNAQRKRIAAEGNLQSAQDRFALAVEGTQDGIFDWDLVTNKVYYSRRCFTMLGYDRVGSLSTPEELMSLIHEDDKERVWKFAQQYLQREFPEYVQEFRMQHKSGRWVWIQSRGKALFDKNGKAYRMVGAHTDITVMKEQQEQLESDKKKAEDANQAKSDFLAHMSHEIRTPLTAISGVAEIFQKSNDNLNDKQRQLVKVLNQSSTTLKDLINDILDFSKIESGELELSEEKFELDKLFESINSMMALRANEKGIGYVFDYSQTAKQEYTGDQVRLRQILINLVGNAVKFTEQGKVSVISSLQKKGADYFIRIDVQDTGIGINNDVFDVIFERFKQGDSSIARKYGGTGLGLPISRNLALLMGGDIILTSQIGKGSTFTLLLPLKKDLPVMVSETHATAPKRKKNGEKPTAANQDERHALLVEDYEGNIVIISYLLDEMGIAFDVARTGTEALDLWQKNHYDIVLMDVQMPEMDGFTATQKIRETETEKSMARTPIVGMTAHALIGDRDRCIESGMDAYMPKPIDEDRFKELVTKYIGKTQTEAA